MESFWCNDNSCLNFPFSLTCESNFPHNLYDFNFSISFNVSSKDTIKYFSVYVSACVCVCSPCVCVCVCVCVYACMHTVHNFPYQRTFERAFLRKRKHGANTFPVKCTRFISSVDFNIFSEIDEWISCHVSTRKAACLWVCHQETDGLKFSLGENSR